MKAIIWSFFINNLKACFKLVFSALLFVGASGTLNTVIPIVTKNITAITTANAVYPAFKSPLPNILSKLVIINNPNVPTMNPAILAKNLGITETSSRSLGSDVKLGNHDQ